MRKSRRLLGLLGLIVAGVTWADDAPARKDGVGTARPFIGTFQVPADQREAVIKHLAAKGFAGSYVPEGAAPQTILYRGTWKEYGDALKVVYGFVKDPETAMEKKPRKQDEAKADDSPGQSGRTDEDAMKAIGISEEQWKKFRVLKKEADRRGEIFKGGGPPNEDLVKKGLEYNRWWNGELKKILTKEQYAKYQKFWSSSAPPEVLGDDPPVKKVPSGMPPGLEGKTDEEIFGKLELSEKQKKDLDTLIKEKNEMTEEMKQLDTMQERIDMGQKINGKWRGGLQRILTKEQYAKYLEYWTVRKPRR